MKGGFVKEKSYVFALTVIRIYKTLVTEKREFVLSKQLLRSGTAIGALIKEAEHAQSKADFLNKMNVALKEANETEYWIELLRDGEYLSQDQTEKSLSDISELIKMLEAIVKTTKTNLGRLN